MQRRNIGKLALAAFIVLVTVALAVMVVLATAALAWSGLVASVPTDSEESIAGDSEEPIAGDIEGSIADRDVVRSAGAGMVFETGIATRVQVTSRGPSPDATRHERQAAPVNLTSPADRYFIGSPTVLAGTAPPDATAVAVYARGSEDWQRLDLDGDGELTDADTVPVAANGTWASRPVLLSSATTVVTGPGQYGVGAVVVDDVRTDDGGVPAELSPDAFDAARSDDRLVTVEPPPFVEPSIFRDVNNQVATEDGTVTVRGVARGVDEVLVVMVDRRGRIASEILSVDDDDVFEEDDVPLVTADGTPLSEGPIVGVVYSTGRDGVMGDGELAGFTEAELPEFVAFVRQRVEQGGPAARTQEQVLEIFASESVAEAGSDDLQLIDFFTYTDGRTSIEAVVPADAPNATEAEPLRVGDTLVVQGLTNRKPDDNTITVEVVEGPTPDAFDLPSTDEWGTDGVWQVELATADAEPGTYVIEADDGESTDRVEIELLPAEANGTGTPGTEPNGTGTPGTETAVSGSTASPS